MNRKWNSTVVETDGVRTIAGGGTGASTAEHALTNLGAATAAQGALADTSIQKDTDDTTPVNVIRCITQAEYDALGTYDPNTLYFIK